MILLMWRNRHVVKLLLELFEEAVAALEDGHLDTTERSALLSRFWAIVESVHA